MTSKTFKCVEHEEEVLEVYPFTGEEAGRKFSLLMPHVSSNAGIAFDSTTAPALALAILEAAWLPECEPNSVNHAILSDLNRVVELQERITAEAEVQAKLEAEALELENAGREATGAPLVESMSDMTADGRKVMLAVARRAREINKENQ